MSFKQMLKMKLPFTRKGLEDYLDERFSRMEEAMRAQTAELSVLSRSGQMGRTNVGLKQTNKQVFLFSVTSTDSGAMRLAQTFHYMGYAVHYLYGSAGVLDIWDPAVPLMEYTCTDVYSLDKLTDTLCTGALFVFAISDRLSQFSPYYSFARKYGFASICLENEGEMPLPDAPPEAWYSYCDMLLQRVEPTPPIVPLISVIVLNHNNRKVIFRCVDSLLAFKSRYGYEIIVVDNDSTDGSPEELEESYGRQIILLRNQKNGCASGRNMGVEVARGEFLYFLDSDQWIVSPRHLDNALDIMYGAYQVGAVGWAAGWFSREYGVAGPISDDFPNRGISSPQVLYRTDVAYLGSGGLFMRKALFHEIGGFDEAYDPTCFEDTDLSLKVKHAGYKLAYCPYMGLLHQPHQTTNSGSDSHRELMNRNGAYFARKWKEVDSSLLEVYTN